MTETPRVCPLSTRDLVDRCVVFIEALADVGFYTYQSLFARRIVESVIENDGETITGLWARQCGKTETVADVGIGLCVILPTLAREFPDDERLKPYVKGFSCGIYAPILLQSGFAFERMRDKVTSEKGEAILHDQEIDVHVVTNRGDTLAFDNGSCIVAKSASPDTQVEGDTHNLIFCEEAQKLLRSKVEKELVPMLTSTNGTMVKIGTAWESRGGFHHSIQENQDAYKRGGKRNHFEFPYEIVLDEKRRAYEKTKNPFHLLYEKSVQKQITRLGGTDSDEFKMNYRCLWHESRVIAVQAEIFRRMQRTDMESGPRRNGFQVAGLDIGKINDSTVLTLGWVDREHPITNMFTLPDSDEDKQVYYKKTILDWLELGGPFEGDAGQYRRLVQYLEMTSVQVLVIDSTTMGDPVFERIEAMIGGTVMCVPFRFTSLSKSNLYKYYLQEFNAGRVEYVAGPETVKRYEYGKFQLEHLDLDKETVGGYAVCRAPEGGHDDYPDSAAMMAWAEKVADQVIMPDIQVTTSNFGGGASRRGPMNQEVESEGSGRGTILEMMARSQPAGVGDRAARYRSGRR
jgi:hypothetical protein